MNQIDLQAQYGKVYKITVDPAARGQRKIDPMYWVIQCKCGEIYPHGQGQLAVMVTGKKLANKMKQLDFLEIVQNCRDVIVFKFSVANFELVTEIVKPRKKRQLSSQVARKMGVATAYRQDFNVKVQRSHVG